MRRVRGSLSTIPVWAARTRALWHGSGVSHLSGFWRTLGNATGDERRRSDRPDRGAVRNGTDAQLRANGGVMPPTVYILAEDLDQPYVGYLTCRPFYRGADASRATAKLVLVGESRRGQAPRHQPVAGRFAADLFSALGAAVRGQTMSSI